jgi:NADH dehydrogenase FAD-containing subunit
MGHERVFAIGDVSDAGRDTAGLATFQAQVAVANVRALITAGELTSYER